MWQYNVELFQWINGFSQFPLIRTIAPILADLPIFFLPIFLTFYWLYYTIKKMDRVHKENILFLFYAPVIAIIISLIIQSIVHFERPETATVNKNFLLLEHIPDASFPSDHTSVGVAFLLGLYFAGYKRTFWAFFPWVILMCVSRVISGVHWPVDIFAGLIVGVLSAFLSFGVLQKIKWVAKWNHMLIGYLSYIKL